MAKILSAFALLICLHSGISANFQKNENSAQITTPSKIDYFPEPPHCGFAKYQISSKNRILNGVHVQPHQLPWMVFFSVGCGGTLINSLWVLTAAHCFYRGLPEYYLRSTKVFLKARECEIKYGAGNCYYNSRKAEIGQIILHEQYDPHEKYNDIALIKLKNAVVFNEKVQPICLPYNNLASGSALFDKPALVSGWGRTHSYEKVYSKHLLQTHVTIWDSAKCEAFRELDHHVMKHELQLCAGGLAGIDSCEGDSGGPLFMRLPAEKEDDKNVPYYQVGIVSFGHGDCGADGYPGVYVNVSSYIPWIRNTILSNE